MITAQVVVFFRAPDTTALPVRTLLLRLAALAWREGRQRTLLIDADTDSGLTRAAGDPETGLLPRPDGVTTFDDLLDSIARFDPVEPNPWPLSSRARSLIPVGPDPFGAHSRALGAVVSTGGALNLADKVDDILRSESQHNHLTFVAAPAPGSGLGMLLGALSDRIVVLGDSFRDLRGPLLAIDRLATVAGAEGPDQVIPVSAGNRGAQPRSGVLERGPTVVLPTLDDDTVSRLLDTILGR